jgi:hypothetical protein
LARLHAACMAVRPFARWSGRKWRSACNRRVVACTARVAGWLLLPWTGLHDVWDPAPAPWGENLGACRRRLNPQRLRAQVGRVAFKRGATPLEGNHVLRAPLMHRAFPSSEPPGWGTPAVLPPCRRRNATSWKLVPLSHRSASRIFIRQHDCIPSLVVTQDGDHQLDVGEKQAGLRPLPLPQPQGFSSPVLGRGVCRVGVGPCAGGDPLLPSVIRGKGVRRSRHGQLPRARLSEPSGFRAAPGAAFRHGSWKRFRRRRASRRHPWTDLQLYGLLPILASRVGGMGEGLMAAASALRSSPLLFGPPEQKSSSLPLLGWAATSRSSVFCCSAGPPPPIAGGCSYLRRWNRSSICKGTLSAGVLFNAAVEA